MTDKEITREKTFSEELPHFKERIEEVFDNYNNPNGNEDPLYICVLRDSKHIVRKAEEEIARQKAEIEELKNYVNRCKSGKEYWVKCLLEKPNEAIKEFAEKAKENFLNLQYNAKTDRKTVKIEELKEQMDWLLHTVAIETVENLLKEMVCE